MGTLKNGFNGSFSGKVGNVIGSSWRGKSYLKSLPKISDKPKSEKQVAQQAKFALAVRFLHPIKELLNRGFRQQNRMATGFNLALKLVLQNAIVGDYPNFCISYPEVLFTKGALGGPECVKLLADAAGVTFGWHSEDIYRAFRFADDKVGILLYEPVSNTYLKGPEGLIRSDGIAFIPVPIALYGKALHAYAFCVSRDGRISNSVYAGSTIIVLVNL